MRQRLKATVRNTATEELAVLSHLSRPAKAGVSRAKHPREDEVLRPGLSLRTERRKGALVLTLSGSDADDRLLEKLREVLRAPLT